MPSRSLPGLSETQREALIRLLPDDDPAVYRTVREKILSYGQAACDWLRPHTLSGDPVLRRRAQEIVNYFGRLRADNAFLGFCLKHGEDLDIEQGAWLLSQTQYPDVNVEAQQALLDAYADVLRERIDSTAPGKIILTPINDFLFTELNFMGNAGNYYDPENSYLNRVLDRRTGNPISLCLVYLLIARRLRLPVVGIGLPGHFLCRYQSTSEEIYIDAFNRGRFLTKANSLQHLVHASHGLQGDQLSPINPRRMLMRMCSNLHQAYLRFKQTEEATRLQRYLIALAR